MNSKFLVDKRFYHVLARIDRDLAALAREGGCKRCEGVLHSARFPRKPRGTPADLGGDGEWRASFCCAACRKRATPPSVRYLGRRVYLGAVVVLAAAMQQGPAPWRASRLRELFGVSLQTLARWRAWWQEAFVESSFWNAAKAAFSPPVGEAGSAALAARTIRRRRVGAARRVAALAEAAVNAGRVRPGSPCVMEIVTMMSTRRGG